ncbi:MAG: CHAT domain-containing protein [Phormidesmis sp.]
MSRRSRNLILVQQRRQELEKRVTDLRHALQVDEASRAVEYSTDRKATVISTPSPALHTTEKLEQYLKSLYADLIAPVADALPPVSSPCASQASAHQAPAHQASAPQASVSPSLEIDPSVSPLLVIEPHSALWLLPFATLKTSDGTWMGDQWPLLYAPSLKTLEEIRQEPPYAPLADSKAVVVGNPVMPTVPTKNGFQLTLNNLPGAEKEAKAIGNVLTNEKTQILIGAEATEARVKELSQTYNIMHLATHGIAYASDPLASFVAFTPTDTENGLLTAREVAINRSLPLDLVVLSACQTGLGKVSGDGMVGLSRAFLIAGARTVVVSQWSVDDAATAALMVEFYRAYCQHGQKAIALQSAMQSIRAHPNYAHPRYWSAFLAVGAES